MAQRTILQRIREFFSTSSDAIVTRVRSTTRRWRSSFRQPQNDWARSDYDFWRRAYHGRAKGLELSGLLIKPIVSKLSSWTLGRAPKWKCDGKTSQKALDMWWTEHHPDILRAWRGALKVADSFVVINADLSITLLPPDSVDPIVDDDDYGNITGWRVTQTLSHPETTARQVMVDEYYVDRRVHRVEVNGVVSQETVYPNLIGRLPFVHIANQPDTGEVFGHAEAEPLLGLMHKYGEVFDAAIEGNILQGRPTPVAIFEDRAGYDKFVSDYGGTERETLPDGTTRTTPTYDVDLAQTLALVGADFKYEAPGSFTGDTAQLLEIMFYLILEHSELPEFIFGNAISSSKASTETQMPVFIEFIKARRGEMVAWLVEIAEIALAYLSLTTPRVRAQTPALQWEALDQEDGALTLETIKWAFGEGLLDELTALQLMPVEVDDAQAVLNKARQEREERQAQALQQMEAETQIAAANSAPPVNEMVLYSNGHNKELGDEQLADYRKTRQSILRTRASMGYGDAIEALRKEYGEPA